MGDADVSTVIASLRSDEKTQWHRRPYRCHFSFSSRAGRPPADAELAMTEINLGTALTVHSS
jgi:hypothetical protein